MARHKVFPAQGKLLFLGFQKSRRAYIEATKFHAIAMVTIEMLGSTGTVKKGVMTNIPGRDEMIQHGMMTRYATSVTRQLLNVGEKRVPGTAKDFKKRSKRVQRRVYVNLAESHWVYVLT